jgi:hypothetical protein
LWLPFDSARSTFCLAAERGCDPRGWQRLFGGCVCWAALRLRVLGSSSAACAGSSSAACWSWAGPSSAAGAGQLSSAALRLLLVRGSSSAACWSWAGPSSAAGAGQLSSAACWSWAGPSTRLFGCCWCGAALRLLAGPGLGLLRAALRLVLVRGSSSAAFVAAGAGQLFGDGLLLVLGGSSAAPGTWGFVGLLACCLLVCLFGCLFVWLCGWLFVGLLFVGCLLVCLFVWLVGCLFVGWLLFVGLLVCLLVGCCLLLWGWLRPRKDALS